MRYKRSKYYRADESWTRRPAWAFEIRADAIRNAGGQVELRCQKASGSTGYHRLLVPLSYLEAHFGDLYQRTDHATVSLFLSAEPAFLFVDQRGQGNVPFGQFLVS